MPRVTSSFVIDRDLLKQVDECSSALGVSRSELLEMWITEKLEEQAIALKAFAEPVIREALVSAFCRPGMLTAFARAMGEEVEPQQLELFQKSMAQAGAAAVAGHQAPAKVPSRKQPQRRKRKKT